MNTISIAGGSVVGRAHRRAGRGSQDAFASAHAGGAAIAVVCDGCGGGARSEVGAAIGARLWTAAIAAQVETGAGVDLDRARDAVLAQLGALAIALGGALDEVVRTHLLFTTVVAVWTPARLEVRAIGDGVIAIDGLVTTVGPFADNEPPYLAYGLLGATPPWSCTIARASSDARTVLIATDGATALAELAPFTDDARWFAHPDALRRRLAVINREELIYDAARGAIERRGAPLDDDTTIVVMRRTP
jgi:hypothetical protein